MGRDRRRRGRLLLAGLTGLLAGCGGDATRSAVARLRAVVETPPPPPDTIPEMLDYAASLGVNVADMKKLPEGLLYDDVSPGRADAGDTTAAAPGDSVDLRYDGFLPSGTKVDSGVVAIRIGGGGVIRGLELAIPGMRAGGKRKLVLPPGLGYGADGTETVPPNSVLVYDVELRRIIR
jgi:hypothetical protein